MTRDEWAPKGAFDFEEFAANFPISVMFRLVGAPVEEIYSIRSSLETLGLAFSMDKDRVPEIHASFDRLENLVQRVRSTPTARLARAGARSPSASAVTFASARI